jgi:hypothetical protein
MFGARNFDDTSYTNVRGLDSVIDDDFVTQRQNNSSGGGWTDDGTVVRLTTATDQVGIGTAAPAATRKTHVLATGLTTGLRSETILATDAALDVLVTGDVVSRWLVQGDGQQQWGDGAAAADTFLSRGTAANSVQLGSGNTAGHANVFAAGLQSSSENGREALWSNGRFTVNGDAQRVETQWRIVTTDGTVDVEMFLDGAALRFVLPDQSAYEFVIELTARRTDVDGEGAAFRFVGGIDRQTGAATTALLGTVSKTIIHRDDALWNAFVTADAVNGALRVRVTGRAGRNIRWVASGWLTKAGE